MTREEARKAAEVMLAYAEGKSIEAQKGGISWFGLNEAPTFNWNVFDYRVKPEQTYRPFKDKEECWAEMQKYQPFGWLYKKTSDVYVNINGMDSVCVRIYGEEDAIDYTTAFEEFTFADGTPFGVKEK